LFVVIGMVALMASVAVGFVLDGGKLVALAQISGLVIIGGAGFSSLLAATSPQRLAAVLREILSLLKPDPYGRSAYVELLHLLYELSSTARREGLLILESHVERPEESDIFRRFPTFSSSQDAVAFLCDSMRLVIMGGLGPFELNEMMEGDIESFGHQVRKSPALISRIGDAMPGFGIVAAVLGVVVTMQAINGPPEQIGHKVAAALVGTFLGVLMCYGVFQPISMALEARAESGVRYLTCLRCGLLAFAQGLSPMLVVEFTRRNIESDVRPDFKEVEGILRRRGAAAAETDRLVA